MKCHFRLNTEFTWTLRGHRAASWRARIEQASDDFDTASWLREFDGVAREVGENLSQAEIGQHVRRMGGENVRTASHLQKPKVPTRCRQPTCYLCTSL